MGCTGSRINLPHLQLNITFLPELHEAVAEANLVIYSPKSPVQFTSIIKAHIYPIPSPLNPWTNNEN